MKKKCLSLALVLSLLLSVTAAFTPVTASAATDYEYTGDFHWRLVWHDEFDGVNHNGGAYNPTTGGRGGGVDKSNWGFQNGNGGAEDGNPGWGNGESENYIPEMASVINDPTATDGKALNIHAQAKAGSGYTDLIADGGTWYSAKLITSKLARNYKNGDNNARGSVNPATGYDGTYGRIEARIKLPNALGTWPAFWMMPSLSVYGGWAASGEIDIMEQTSGQNTIGGTIHCGGPWPGNWYRTQSYTFPAGESSKDWHVYAIEWDPAYIRWYVDDRSYGIRYNTEWSTTGAPGNPYAPFDQDFYIILNLATNGVLGGRVDPSGPVDMYIDYVRVYQYHYVDPPFYMIVSPDRISEGRAYDIDVTLRSIFGFNFNEAGTVQVGIEGCPSTYITTTASANGNTATGTIAVPAGLLAAGAYNVIVIWDGDVWPWDKGALTVQGEDFNVKYWLLHKDTGKTVGTDLRGAAFMNWSVNQSTYKAIYDSADGIEQYTLFDLSYGFANTRYYLLAGNGRYLTIEGGLAGGFGGVNIDARITAKGTSDASWEALVFHPQADGAIKISNISTTGERWIDVRANGDLYMVTAEPGESGKFYLREYTSLNPVIVTGQVQSYNPGKPATLKLMQDGKVKYTASIAAASGSGQVTQFFHFSNVEPGNYTLVVAKDGHTSFTVQTVAVGGNILDLTRDSRPAVQRMTLLCGDINGDQMINDNDLIVLWQAANYNKSAEQAANPLCDLNGDGVINDNDLIILWLAVNYNKGPVVVG